MARGLGRGTTRTRSHADGGNACGSGIIAGPLAPRRAWLATARSPRRRAPRAARRVSGRAADPRQYRRRARNAVCRRTSTTRMSRTMTSRTTAGRTRPRSSSSRGSAAGESAPGRLRLRSGRPPGVAQPVTVLVNGVEVKRFTVGADWQTVPFADSAARRRRGMASSSNSAPPPRNCRIATGASSACRSTNCGWRRSAAGGRSPRGVRSALRLLIDRSRST